MMIDAMIDDAVSVKFPEYNATEIVCISQGTVRSVVVFYLLLSKQLEIIDALFACGTPFGRGTWKHVDQDIDRG
jgi:hypothetical protein